MQIIADAPKRPPGHMSAMAKELLAARKVLEASRAVCHIEMKNIASTKIQIELHQRIEAYDKVVKE